MRTRDSVYAETCRHRWPLKNGHNCRNLSLTISSSDYEVNEMPFHEAGYPPTLFLSFLLAFLLFFLTFRQSFPLFSAKGPRGDRCGMPNGGLFIGAPCWKLISLIGGTPFQIIVWKAHGKARSLDAILREAFPATGRIATNRMRFRFVFFAIDRSGCFARRVKRTCGTITYARSCQWLFDPANAGPRSTAMSNVLNVAKELSRAFSTDEFDGYGIFAKFLANK